MSDFIQRHIGPTTKEQTQMLNDLGLSTIEELVREVVPTSILLRGDDNLPEPCSEHEALQELKHIASFNKVTRCLIGQGYYGTITPPVIQRNVFENPAWYTSYTPYQAEISQGRLEALLNFQTMVIDLTGKEIANASLLDEATAAAEAMAMLYSARPRAQAKAGATTFLVDTAVYPQTFAVMQTRAKSLGINIIEKPRVYWDFTEDMYGCLIQYPDGNGEVHVSNTKMRSRCV